MSVYEPTSEFAAMSAAEVAFAADPLSLEKLHAMDAAVAVFYKALSAARAEWNALADSDAKDSAEQNAYDTEGCAVDELKWFNVALATYEEAKNSGHAVTR